VILYEYPFNERIRTYLRLEQLFGRLYDLLARESPIDHHFALVSLFEIMEVGARSDLKSDLLRDLDKQKNTLNNYRGNPAIDEHMLDEVLQQLDQCFSQLNAQVGKIGNALNDNDWLMSIRSRIGIPGGTCEFDLPAYYAWQHRSGEQRRTDLQRWVSTFTPFSESVVVLLKLQRDAGLAQKVMAVEGQYQQNLPQHRTCQLLQLRIDPQLHLVPEISGNRLMVSIRLMKQEDQDRLVFSTENSPFELTLCS
jgi:cell division protein ZapD